MPLPVQILVTVCADVQGLMVSVGLSWSLYPADLLGSVTEDLRCFLGQCLL